MNYLYRYDSVCELQRQVAGIRGDNLNHAQLVDLIARAQARQTELQREKAPKVRAKIAGLVQAEGLDLHELMGARSPRSPRQGPT